VRLFVKGTDGTVGSFAECLCGSPHLYKVVESHGTASTL
jgi:isoamylase